METNELFENKKINLVGFRDIDPQDKIKIMNDAAATYNKIFKRVANEITITIHLKEHNAQHGKVKSTVHCKLDLPGLFVNANATQWKLTQAVTEALQVLSKETFKKLEKPKSPK